MRLFLVAFSFLLGFGASVPALAQSRADMERCRLIEDTGRRLACYDAIDLSTSEPRTKYQQLELGELKSYALSYRGDLVQVDGWIAPDGEFMFLGSDARDDHPIPIEFETIARRDLQAFRDACGKGCEATVQGRVMPVNFTTGIVADALIAH